MANIGAEDSGLSAAVDRALKEPCVFVAIKQRGEKVCAHLAWMRIADLERLPMNFLQANVIMGVRK